MAATCCGETTRVNATATSISKRPVIFSSVISVAVIGVVYFAWGSQPPQMGPDDAVFTNVDALFTAVTARDEQRLGECEQRLHALKNAGKIPTDAARYLDSVIETARAGRWEPAAQRLYGFMTAQRRDGAGEPTVPKKNKGRPGTPSK
jgi:hypothetical protein